MKNPIYLLLIIFILHGCADRAPSDIRLEKATEIKLTKDYIVLRDEYQDMIQDYCIIYEIKFEDQSSAKLIKNIKRSGFYNSKINPDGRLYDSLFIQKDKKKAVWCRSEKGYRFNGKEGGTSYSVDLDTVTKVMKYIEMYD